jgi:tetratricopeptide (TPR) repeat protein
MNELSHHAEEETPSWDVQVRDWAGTRDYLRLLLGLPAVLALALLAAYGVFLLGWEPVHAEARCYTMAGHAYEGQDYQTARVAYQSLVRLGGKQRQDYAFKLMLCQRRLGQEREAAALAAALAPPTGLGYAPAHLFVAKTLLSDTNAASSRGRAELAISHLGRVLQIDPANLEAQELLSQLFMSLGRPEAAKPYLTQLASTSAQAMLRLAIVLAAEGDIAACHSWAGRAAKELRSQLGRATDDEPPTRLALADALTLQEDFAGANELLQKAIKNTRNPLYRAKAAEVCAQWAGSLAQHSPQDLASRFRVLQLGLELDPQQPGLIQQLAALSNLTGPEAERARAWVKTILAEGLDPGLVHFYLGAAALQQGDRPQAFEHFRRAYKAQPNMPSVANNMALALALQEPPDLDRALGIAQSLVEKQPEVPTFRETRGQILVRLGRFQEALQDLAYALPAIEQRTPTHLALALCYRKLGMADLAQEHERAAAAASPPAPAPAPASK